MTARTTAILGKGGVGKTFFASHLTMAFSYLGVKTLVVGCDQKQDTLRALSAETRPPLMDWLESNDYDYASIAPEQVTVPIGPYADAMELGASPLLVGHYAAVLDEAFHYFSSHNLLDRYEQVIFDVTDERWDSVLAPLFRRVESVVGVTAETPESLFVLNRLLRAAQIGGYELEYPLVLVGVVNNASRDPLAFERYVERTQCFPLMTVPDLPELAGLKAFHRTLFELKSLPQHLEQVLDGFVKIADMLRGEPLNIFPVSSLDDEEVWKLAPAVNLPS